MRRGLAYFVAAFLIAGSFWYQLVVRKFHGVANADTVRVLESKTASTGKVAMLVERSDTAALSGNDVFVFLADYPYTIPQLRNDLYALDPVFQVGDDRLTLEWVNVHQLDIRCGACNVTKEAVTAQKDHQSDIAIRYIDFP